MPSVSRGAGRRRISAMRLQQIGAVKTGGRDLDQHFARGPALGSGISRNTSR